MSQIDRSKIIHGTLIKIKDILSSNVTDPLGANRSSDTRFVMLSFPERKVEYPHIILSHNGGAGERLGVPGNMLEYELRLTITVLSKSTKQRDDIADAVLHALRTKMGDLENFGLYGFTIASIFDAEGEEAHIKHIELGLKVIAT